MVPVAVSVPQSEKELTLRMHFDNWAFGEVVGQPRPASN